MGHLGISAATLAYPTLMHILHVHLKVKAERIDEFIALTIENAKSSVQEPGCLRFELIQDKDDPAHFELNESYRDETGHAAHRESAHYKKWADKALPLLAEPRTRNVYRNVFPEDSDYR